MRLTKFNHETGLYEYIEPAKTQEEFIAQRKAVIQKLGEYEDGMLELNEHKYVPVEDELLTRIFDHYRKTVAEEIFEAVDEMIELLSAMYGDNIIIGGKYAELKKKYTEGDV